MPNFVFNCNHTSSQSQLKKPSYLDQRFSTLGTRTPRGTSKVRRGYAKFHNQLKIRPFYGHWGTILMKFYIWGYSFGTTFIRGYNFGKKLIWGYASTKRLRTPDLDDYLLNKIKIKFQTKTIKLDRNKTFVFFSVRPKTNANNTFKYFFICSILVCFSTFYYYNFFFFGKNLL